MKTEYILLAYGVGKTMANVFTGSHMMSYNMPENVKRAKRWKTWEGVERFIAAEKAKGSDWGYLILPVEPTGASQTASSLGKLGAGISKTITDEESQARRERLAVSRAKRWQK